MKAGSRRRALAVIELLGLAAVGAIVALVAITVFEGGSHAVGPGTVSVRPGLGSGVTDVVIPPLGIVSAETHSGPLSVTLTLTEIDFEALSGAIETPASRNALVAEIEADLRTLAFRATARWMLVAAVSGGIAGAIWWPRRWSHVVAGALGGTVATGLVVTIVLVGFDVEAFREPRFTGTLERAPEIIGAVEAGLGSLDDIRSRYEALAERMSRLLAIVASSPSEPGLDGTAILHVSDVHSNPLGIEITNQLARGFDVDAVIDTGDLTSFGSPIETQLQRLVDDIPVRYLFVPGNHDSRANRATIAKTPNVTVLDSETTRVRDLIILGVGDPTFTATGEVSTEEGNDIRDARADDVARLAADTTPDVLAVHDIRLASAAVGRVPLIVTGHTHRRLLRHERGTVTLTVGSTGATGLGAFTADADMAYEAEILYFRGRRLVALDYVTLEGVGDDFEVERTTLEPTAPQASKPKEDLSTE